MHNNQISSHHKSLVELIQVLWLGCSWRTMTFLKASHNINIILQQDKDTCLCKCGHEWRQTISSDSRCGPWKPLVSTSIIHLQSSLVFKLKLLHYSFAVCWPHLIVLCCSGSNICWCRVIYETFVLLSSPLLRILFGKPIPLSLCLFAVPTPFCVQYAALQGPNTVTGIQQGEGRLVVTVEFIYLLRKQIVGCRVSRDYESFCITKHSSTQWRSCLLVNLRILV